MSTTPPTKPYPTDDEATRANDLATAYLPLAYKLVGEYLRGRPRLGRDDALSAAHQALAWCVRDFDPARGPTFPNLLQKAVRRELGKLATSRRREFARCGWVVSLDTPLDRRRGHAERGDLRDGPADPCPGPVEEFFMSAGDDGYDEHLLDPTGEEDARRIVRAVLETGSLRGAARALGVSKDVIYRHLPAIRSALRRWFDLRY